MRNAAGQFNENDCRDVATKFDIQLTIPRLVNWLDMPTRTANQAKVSHADFSLKQSSQSSTPVNKSIDNPSIAAMTLEIPRASLYVCVLSCVKMGDPSKAMLSGIRKKWWHKKQK